MSVLDTKNPSPRLLSLFTALAISLLNAGLSLIVRPVWYIPIIIFFVSFFIIFYLYYYTLQKFIYRKIKLMYKIIRQTKATKREEFFYNTILPRQSIDEVSGDVQKWAAEQSREVEILRANEQFRKEFLMNLAHELRTPIFTVQGYVDTLLEGAMEDAAVSKKFLTNASKGIDRLARLVDELGEISRLESGSVSINKENFTIQDLIADVFEEMSLSAGEKGVVMNFKKGTEGALNVYADKAKIRQALVNLVENAVKYGVEGGQITAGCYEMDDKHVYVEISDNGPGIAEEHLPRIFERFYRADRSRSRAVGGTGLGLAIVKHIVEAHGQTVNVRSKPGVGSSFGFTLEKGKE